MKMWHQKHGSANIRQSAKGNLRSQVLLGGLFLAISLVFLVVTQTDMIVIKGVPLSILLQALTDSQTIDAYFRGDKPGLHNRLQEMGMEEKIKAFYRPKIRSEEKLDQHIHQIFYELTGYVGLAYKVNLQGTLVPLYPVHVDQTYDHWVALAQKLGLIVGTTQKDGIQYVIAPNGTKIPYSEAIELFSLSQLEQLSK